MTIVNSSRVTLCDSFPVSINYGMYTLLGFVRVVANLISLRQSRNFSNCTYLSSSFPLPQEFRARTPIILGQVVSRVREVCVCMGPVLEWATGNESRR